MLATEYNATEIQYFKLVVGHSNSTMYATINQWF